MKLIKDTFMYVNLGEKGRATLSIGIEEKLDDYKVTVAVAFCSPHDTFSKNFGRSKALGRRLANNNPFVFTVAVPKNEKIKQAVYDRFMQKCESKFFSMEHFKIALTPQWVRKAAIDMKKVA